MRYFFYKLVFNLDPVQSRFCYKTLISILKRLCLSKIRIWFKHWTWKGNLENTVLVLMCNINILKNLRLIRKSFWKHSPGSVPKNFAKFNFTGKETLVQVFFCEFFENFKSTFFVKHPRWMFLDFCKSGEWVLMRTLSSLHHLGWNTKQDQNP